MEQPCSSPHEGMPTIEIYIAGCPTPFEALRDVCFCRSGWIAAQLLSKDEQNQKVVLTGLTRNTADALIQYLQVDSGAIRFLHTDDRRVLVKMFELHELKREMEANEATAATTDNEAKAAGDDTAT